MRPGVVGPLIQWFSKWGPRTPGGPRRVARGSVKSLIFFFFFFFCDRAPPSATPHVGRRSGLYCDRAPPPPPRRRETRISTRSHAHTPHLVFLTEKNVLPPPSTIATSTPPNPPPPVNNRDQHPPPPPVNNRDLSLHYICVAVMRGSLKKILPYGGSPAPYSLRTPALINTAEFARRRDCTRIIRVQWTLGLWYFLKNHNSSQEWASLLLLLLLIYSLQVRAGLNHLAGRIRPAGRMFDTPDLDQQSCIVQ